MSEITFEQIDKTLDVEDKLSIQFTKDFAKQIVSDKKNSRLNNRHFSNLKYNLVDWVKYLKKRSNPYKAGVPDLEHYLEIEDGQTYRQDVKIQNDNWYKKHNPQYMKTNAYQLFIKQHQNYFKPSCIYPLYDEINAEPAPLSHKELWNLLTHFNH